MGKINSFVLDGTQISVEHVRYPNSEWVRVTPEFFFYHDFSNTNTHLPGGQSPAGFWSCHGVYLCFSLSDGVVETSQQAGSCEITKVWIILVESTYYGGGRVAEYTVECVLCAFLWKITKSELWDYGVGASNLSGGRECCSPCTFWAFAPVLGPYKSAASLAI